MARKFQIGDTVQVVKKLAKGDTIPKGFKIGNRGLIVGYVTGGVSYPYEVMRKNGTENVFNVRELKLIKKK